ncbi:MAG: hypothetical protein QF437_25230 [Planctomycetota bacterium]|nr:hypothetical protein [Planctomycetota bacterium]MDP7133824.1 hypothetical protein [Planctomycetota bacterium]
MLRKLDRWYSRGMAVIIAGGLWAVALGLPGSLESSAHAGMDKKEQHEPYALTRKEYAQLLLNSHPYIRILTPHLTSEYLVAEGAVHHLITYDKNLWDEAKIKQILDVRHKNAVTTMRALGFKSFNQNDIVVKYEPY